MTIETDKLYYRMIAADEAFSAALKRQYGHQAGDFRYIPKDWCKTVKTKWRAVEKAMEAYHDAVAVKEYPDGLSSVPY